MDLKLRVLEGRNAGQEISVNGKKFFVGRAEDCQLRPGSDLISRHHCVLLVEDGYVGVRDFGSKNGTFVNQERVVGERELKAGDRLTIGPLQFEVQMAHGTPPKKRPPVSDIKEAAARTASDAKRDPLDVTQWLGSEGGIDTASVPAAQAPAASMTETDSINLSNTQTFVQETPAAEAPEPASPAKKPTGKLPPIPANSKDSQSAAAAALNKFRKRR